MTTTAATLGSPTIRSHKALHVALWVAQILLAAAFGMAGVMKTTRPIAELAQMMVWPGALPPGLVRFIGASELAGALGLILPAVTRIKPGLTPLAAAGLALVMLLACVFHLSRGEVGAVPASTMRIPTHAYIASTADGSRSPSSER